MSHSRSLVPSGFDDFFMSPFMSDPFAHSFLAVPAERSSDARLRRSSPCYEITEDEKQSQLAVDVPGVKASDMNMQLENGGRVLHLSGGRKMKRGDKVVESKFEKTFTIDRSVDTSKISANLADGVLVVTLPKVEKGSDIQKIAITENPNQDA